MASFGLAQRFAFLVLTKRKAGSGDEIGILPERPFPVPLDKGNEGSGYEIDLRRVYHLYEEVHVLFKTRPRQEQLKLLFQS